jgi:hypothetical protein
MFSTGTQTRAKRLRTREYIMCNGPTNALVCNKTLIQMSHIKTLKITPTCFDHQGAYFILVKIT